MDSTMDKLEEYLSAMEEYVFASLSSAAPEGMKDKMNQLWIDITRYGPSISINDVTSRIPSPFEIPPPPPPPPPKSWSEMAADWVDENPRILACATVVGVGILAGLGYRRSWYGRKIRRLGSKAGKAVSRRKVVGSCTFFFHFVQYFSTTSSFLVVLGADTSPLALPLILELERNGYIVIASVTSVEAVDELERKCRGSDQLKAGDSGSGSYVKALVLDPTSALPDAVPVFLRSLASTLGRRFPITASGDPYASPADHPYVQAVVSLLTMPSNSPLSVSSETSITHVSSHAPLEHISLRSTYLSYLSRTQITPLQVIQGLLPLLRNVHVPSEKEEPKMVVVCVPSESATSVSPGLAFKSLQTMSSVSTRAAISVLRDEVDVAARTGKSEGMRGIRVVEVNVDSSILDTLSYESLDNATTTTEQDVYKAMEKWTASEKVTYGPAFIRFVEDNFTPTKARSSNLNSKSLFESSIFTQTILAVVSNGKSGYGYGYGPGTSFSRRLGRVFGFGTGLFGFAGKRDSVVIRRGNGKYSSPC
ncbi:hypothetical protein BDP27DRAFT_1041115 [Rhodocollybia butyracea]|uniref:DUF1776-domain-containing protein n=1 Tax=Rhodocollybia butyracea TaxID=206335 RepID=A0A9P5UDW5_9AGAR|nr:hypothetical protein BDP27DRAFT_1041115 [Rhodocollybia butyracea]